MTWQLTETPIRALAAYIQSGTVSADKLANIEARAEYADWPATLADFVAIRHHEPPDNPEAEYPVLYMRPIRTRLKVGPGGLRRGFIGQHDYMVAIICASMEGPDMALAMAERYMLAVVEMIAEYFSRADSRTIEWAMGNDPEILYEPLYTSQAGEFFSDARMLISAQVSEGAIA